jgi:hypothetical protein
MRVLGGLLFVVLPVLFVALVAAVVLAVGTGLAHLFGVSTFEASVVVLVVGAGVYFWTGLGLPRRPATPARSRT